MNRPILYNGEKLPVTWISLGDSITIISKFIKKIFFLKSIHFSWYYNFKFIYLQIFGYTKSNNFNKNKTYSRYDISINFYVYYGYS